MEYMLGNPQGMVMSQIIELGNNEHFSKLTCSIIPTIDYWKNLDNKILSELINGDCNICFEYPVKSINNAMSSYTDVMLISNETVVAIETKWRENIGVYCIDQNAVRKDEVQLHWINIISTFLNKEFTLEQFSNIEYQLLHRVASACSLGKENCKVVYQIFYLETLKLNFTNEIRKIIQLLDDPRIEFYVDAVRIELTDRYIRLAEEIINLDRMERINKIKYALKECNLFEFSHEKLERLT